MACGIDVANARPGPSRACLGEPNLHLGALGATGSGLIHIDQVADGVAFRCSSENPSSAKE